MHWLGWLERPVYSRPRHEPRTGADLEALRRLLDRLLRRVDPAHLPASSGFRAPFPSTRSTSGAVVAGTVVEHERLVRDEHELAELRRRVDDVVPVADGRPHRAAVRLDGRRSRGRHRPRPRLRPPQLEDDRQLLGRHHALHALHRAAHRLRLRPHLRRPGRRADPERTGAHPRRPEQLDPGHRRSAPSASWKRSSSSGRTGAASSTGTGPIRSRTRPGSRTSCQFVLLLSVSFSLTYTFGKMVGSIRQGVALLAAMVILFGAWVGFSSYSEHVGNPAVAAAGIKSQPGGQHGGQRGPFRRHPVDPLRHRLDPDLDRERRRLQRLLHRHGRLRAADGHDARGGLAGRNRQRAVHDPHLRHHRRVHRRADDRANTGVHPEEDPGQGGEAGWARFACHAARSF